MSNFWIFRRASRADFAENTMFYKGFGQKGLFFARRASRAGMDQITIEKMFYQKGFKCFWTINSGILKKKSFQSFLWNGVSICDHSVMEGGYSGAKVFFQSK